jgi:uncharacterized membrane protein YesL
VRMNALVNDTNHCDGYSLITALRQWVSLVKLNTLFLLFALPLVTLPAAYCAALDISADLLRNQYHSPFMLTRFLNTFRRTFVLSMLAGLVILILEFIAAGSLYFYSVLAKSNLLYSLLCALAFAVMLAVLLLGISFYTALATHYECSVRELLKLALYSTLLKPWLLLFGCSSTVLFWMLHIITFPFSIFLPTFFSLAVGIVMLTITSIQGVNQAFELLQLHKGKA